MLTTLILLTALVSFTEDPAAIRSSSDPPGLVVVRSDMALEPQASVTVFLLSQRLLRTYRDAGSPDLTTTNRVYSREDEGLGWVATPNACLARTCEYGH